MAFRCMFSYARVLGIPIPTWQAYDEKRFGIKMAVEGIPRTHQERAYTSPIWYTPGAEDGVPTAANRPTIAFAAISVSNLCSCPAT